MGEPLDLDELRRLYDDRDPGPWEWQGSDWPAAFTPANVRLILAMHQALPDLLAEVDALRSVVRHALTHWVPSAGGKHAHDVFAEWDDTDWADSSWTPAEQEVIRSALDGVAAEPNEGHDDGR